MYNEEIYTPNYFVKKEMIFVLMKRKYSGISERELLLQNLYFIMIFSSFWFCSLTTILYKKNILK